MITTDISWYLYLFFISSTCGVTKLASVHIGCHCPIPPAVLWTTETRESSKDSFIFPQISCPLLGSLVYINKGAQGALNV